jgi:thiol-disulfide isomerase/thioredoxin
MSFLRPAVLYTALIFGANPAAADIAAADAARSGDMQKLNFAEAVDVPAAELLDLEDGVHSLEEYKGHWVLVNFWATWCAPCRVEMPGLDRLQGAMEGEDFTVVTVASGRNPVPAIEKFFGEAGVENLPVLRDPNMELSRAMGIMGLPVTVILNPEGQEVARLTGDAVWDGPEAMAVIKALLDRP